MAKILDTNLKNDPNHPEKLSNNSSTLNNSNPIPKEESGLVKTIGQCLTFAPLVFEQFTGQKVPVIGGTIAEIQHSIQQISTSLVQVINNQQEIFSRLVNLETNANNHLISLDKRMENLTSIRLTHEREKKQIECNQSPKLEENNYD
jgi:hypothetical protein